MNPARGVTPRPILREAYAPPAYVVERVSLVIDLDPGETRVAATLDIRRDLAMPANAPLVLHGEEQALHAIRIDGVPLTPAQFTLTADALTIAQVPARCTVDIESSCNPAANSALDGLYLTSGVFCTQCEAEGFRRITYFTDRPDVLAVYTVELRADRARFPVLLSNGDLVAEGVLEDGRGFAR